MSLSKFRNFRTENRNYVPLLHKLAPLWVLLLHNGEAEKLTRCSWLSRVSDPHVQDLL